MRSLVFILLLLICSCKQPVKEAQIHGLVTNVTRKCSVWVVTINHNEEFCAVNMAARDVLSTKNKKVILIYDENNRVCFTRKILDIKYE